MVEFRDVRVENFEGLSLKIDDGLVCRIVVSYEHDRQALMDVLLGLKKPDAGSIIMGRTDIYAVESLGDAYGRTAAAWSGGGLIGNLSVWENLTLPVWYHTGAVPDNTAQEVAEILQAMEIEMEIGMDVSEFLEKHLYRLPGFLPPHLKTLFGIVRAMLMAPEVVIYDSAFEAFGPSLAARIARAARAFHVRRKERVSLYLTPEARFAKELEPDITVALTERGFLTI
jgi:phospholipid/cholesterol/gamma-HCH transport system ATP-binding protein